MARPYPAEKRVCRLSITFEEAAIHRVRIPDKHYFKIGEAAAIADVPTHVLRFWETEFKRIKPLRTPSGQRLYRRKDVELILEIKHCLYDRKFTIEGARRHLKKAKLTASDPMSLLAEIRRELSAIRDILDADPRVDS